MNPKYKNLILFALLFGLVAVAGIKFAIFGAFLTGLYVANGIAHFGYGITGFGKMTPKKLFGEERTTHSFWGVYNFVLSSVLAYYSNLEANWLLFIIALLITFLLLPGVAKKEK